MAELALARRIVPPLLCVLVSPSLAFAQPKSVQTAGWELHASSCIALYAPQRGVSLTPSALTVHFQGRAGVSTYAYVLDDAPPVAVPFVHPLDNEAASFSIEGGAFESLKRARRLRFQATTVTAFVPIEDVDLSNVADVLRHFRGSNCKIQDVL